MKVDYIILVFPFRREEEEEEEDTFGRRPGMLSSLSTERLQQELMKCSSDGLSDKEHRLQLIKCQVRNQPHVTVSECDISKGLH